MLVVLEAGNREYWIVHMVLSDFSLLPLHTSSHQTPEMQLASFCSLHAYSFSGNARVSISDIRMFWRCLRGFTGLVEGFCCSVPVPVQYRGGIWQCRRCCCSCCSWVLHSLKPAGALPVWQVWWLPCYWYRKGLQPRCCCNLCDLLIVCIM